MKFLLTLTILDLFYDILNFCQLLMKIKIFDNVKDEKKLDKFWQILIILTILNFFDNVDHDGHSPRFLIFDNFDIFGQCWKFWTGLTFFENVRWLWRTKMKKILTTFDNFCLQMLIIFAIFLSSIHDNFSYRSPTWFSTKFVQILVNPSDFHQF